jgi:hypothetical protein
MRSWNIRSQSMRSIGCPALQFPHVAGIMGNSGVKRGIMRHDSCHPLNTQRGSDTVNGARPIRDAVINTLPFERKIRQYLETPHIHFFFLCRVIIKRIQFVTKSILKNLHFDNARSNSIVRPPTTIWPKTPGLFERDFSTNPGGLPNKARFELNWKGTRAAQSIL